MKDRHIRRMTFDQQAETYDQQAGGYPPELIADIIEFSGITADGRILEVGCGTGQATRSFAERGYAITAVELGANLIALAQKNLAQFPKIEFVNEAFEDWDMQPGTFDLMFAADAFHWIPPQLGYPKAAESLKPGGTVALFWWVDRRTDPELSAQIQQVYDEVAPEFPNPLNGGAATSDFTNEKVHTNVKFAPTLGEPVVRKYPYPQRITAEAHLKGLTNFSMHQEMEPTVRQALHRRITQVINAAGGELVIEREVMVFLIKKA